MVRLQVSLVVSGSRSLADITLSYTDVFAQRSRETRQQISAQTMEMAYYDPLAYIEVRHNATIVHMTETLKEIDHLFNERRYQEAWYIAYEMEHELRAVGALTSDQQMVQDADLFQRYQITLATALGYDPANGELSSTPYPPSEPQYQR